MSSALQSQTPSEQTDLIKYECNLASCYEAEYLLSLKLQDDIYGGRSEGDGMYCDDYEVVSPNCGLADEGVCYQVPDSMDTELPSSTNTVATKSLVNSVDMMMNTPTSTTDSSHLVGKSSTCPEAMDCGTIKCSSSQSEDERLLSNLLSDSSPQCHCIDSDACSFRGNVHCEGPSRKRMCLHHDKTS